MSARQQFQFPPTSAQSPAFAPDPENPLHLASQEKMTNDSASSSMRKTGGLGAIMNRKRSNPVPAMGPSPMNALARPGTADPYSRNRSSMVATGQTPVVAPTPQVPRSSPLLSRDTNSKMNFGFKVPSMLDPAAKGRRSAENNAHISTLDAVSPIKNAVEMFPIANSDSAANGFMPLPNLKFNPVHVNTVARRISISKDLGNYDALEGYAGSPVLPGHEITGEGRVKAMNPLKRMHDEVDEDGENTSFEQPTKRYKHTQSDEGNKNFEDRFSPQTAERPSSGLSHSEKYRSNGSASGDAGHFSAHRQRLSGSPSTPHKSTSSPYQPQPIVTRREPGPLARLLGQDPDVFVQEHMDEYDEMIKRWSDCTMEEWLASADEIMSDFNKILDMVRKSNASIPMCSMTQRIRQVKEHVGAKLRKYANIHENINKHNASLRERSDNYATTTKKLREESGSVLNH